MMAAEDRNSARDVYGQGLSFPFQFHRQFGGARLSTVTSRDHAHIHESIWQILGTRRGERFLRPDFGCRLPELLFEPNTDILHGLIRHEVEEALTRWEPRMAIDDISVTANEAWVQVTITYYLVATATDGIITIDFARGVV